MPAELGLLVQEHRDVLRAAIDLKEVVRRTTIFREQIESWTKAGLAPMAMATPLALGHAVERAVKPILIGFSFAACRPRWTPCVTIRRRLDPARRRRR